MARSKELPSEPQQSRGWEKFQASQGFIKEGFPFHEGFPRQYVGRQYTIMRLYHIWGDILHLALK